MSEVLLADRQIFKIFGNDKEQFLQGLLTCDVRQRPCYGALLSPNGRFLYDFFVVEEGDHWLIDVPADHSDEILKKLNLYKLKSDVRLEKDDRKVLAVIPGKSDKGALDRGPISCNITGSSHLNSEHHNLRIANGSSIKDSFVAPVEDDMLSYKDPRYPDMGYRSYRLDPNRHQDDNAFLEYTDHRIALGIPEGPLDLIYDRSIILECNFIEMNAVSFTKGCYIGQELIARTYHLGAIRKRLMPINLEQDQGQHEEFYRSIGKHYAMAMLAVI